MIIVTYLRFPWAVICLIIGACGYPFTADASTACDQAFDYAEKFEDDYNASIRNYRNSQIELRREVELNNPETAELVLSSKVIPDGEYMIKMMQALVPAYEVIISVCKDGVEANVKNVEDEVVQITTKDIPSAEHKLRLYRDLLEKFKSSQ